MLRLDRLEGLEVQTKLFDIGLTGIVEGRHDEKADY
jgi:hypothetical protein